MLVGTAPSANANAAFCEISLQRISCAWSDCERDIGIRPDQIKRVLG
jgi:hypothetical protein